MKGGHPWHGAVVCPGTTMGRQYTCFQSSPCGSTVISLTHAAMTSCVYILILHTMRPQKSHFFFFYLFFTWVLLFGDKISIFALDRSDKSSKNSNVE